MAGVPPATSGPPSGGAALDARVLRLIATAIDCCGRPRAGGCGRPPAATERVLAALRRFLREGTPWRGLRATEAEASGATLRRLQGLGIVGGGLAVLTGRLARQLGARQREGDARVAAADLAGGLVTDGGGVPLAVLVLAPMVLTVMVVVRAVPVAPRPTARLRS